MKIKLLSWMIGQSLRSGMFSAEVDRRALLKACDE